MPLRPTSYAVIGRSQSTPAGLSTPFYHHTQVAVSAGATMDASDSDNEGDDIPLAALRRSRALQTSSTQEIRPPVRNTSQERGDSSGSQRSSIHLSVRPRLASRPPAAERPVSFAGSATLPTNVDSLLGRGVAQIDVTAAGVKVEEAGDRGQSETERSRELAKQAERMRLQVQQDAARRKDAEREVQAVRDRRLKWERELRRKSAIQSQVEEKQKREQQEAEAWRLQTIRAERAMYGQPGLSVHSPPPLSKYSPGMIVQPTPTQPPNGLPFVHPLFAAQRHHYPHPPATRTDMPGVDYFALPNQSSGVFPVQPACPPFTPPSTPPRQASPAFRQNSPSNRQESPSRRQSTPLGTAYFEEAMKDAVRDTSSGKRTSYLSAAGSPTGFQVDARSSHERTARRAAISDETLATGANRRSTTIAPSSQQRRSASYTDTSYHAYGDPSAGSPRTRRTSTYATAAVSSMFVPSIHASPYTLYESGQPLSWGPIPQSAPHRHSRAFLDVQPPLPSDAAAKRVSWMVQ